MRRFALILIFLATLIQCDEGDAQAPTDSGVAVNTKVFEAANFIAASGGQSSPRLKKLRASRQYQLYQHQVNRAWNAYHKRTVAKISKWRNQHLASIQYDSVFYPFGGPDLLNALALFPDADQYVLLGLEATGRIPNPGALSNAQALSGLKKLRGALTRIMGHNFFHTKIMAYKIGSHSYNGIAGVFMFFARRMGYEIIDARQIILSSSGKVVTYSARPKDPKGLVYGVEIKFRKSKDAKVQTAYYLRGDISDKHLFRKKGIAALVSQSNNLVSMLKAASYLMFRAQFDDMRNLILRRSRYIVQDPSGFPFHYLNKPTKWNLRLYGSYVRPIPLFRVRCQPDLARASRKSSKGWLPFAFGYTAPTYGRSLMMVAERKTPLEAVAYDRTFARGQNTYCYKGRLVVDRK